MGQDSTGMFVGMWARGIKPDLIITADIGSERPETYEFKPIFELAGICGLFEVRSSSADMKQGHCRQCVEQGVNDDGRNEVVARPGVNGPQD